MLVLWFGFGLGAVLVVVGAITYFLAPRVGPNPIFGLRTGYSLVSHEVWDKSNRVGGVAMALVGLLALVATPLIVWAVPREGTAFTAIMIIVIGPLLATTGWLFAYTRRLAQGTVPAASLRVVPLCWRRMALPLGSLAVVGVNALVAWRLLPLGRVATHFNLAGEADGWSSRAGLVLVFVIASAILTLIPVIVNLVASREPAIAISHLGGLYMPPGRGLAYIGGAIALTNLFMVVILWDLVSFNTRGVHLAPSLGGVIWPAVAVLLAGIIGLFFVYARRAGGPGDAGGDAGQSGDAADSGDGGEGEVR